MRLIGNKLCVFFDAIESLLCDAKADYSVVYDEAKMDYPTLQDKDLEICGFIAIAEYILGMNSKMRNLEISQNMDQDRRNKYQLEIARTDANRRMWLFVILNEIWYGAAHDILSQRIFKAMQGTDHYMLKQARHKLKSALSDIDIWLSEQIYIVDINCCTDILLATMIAHLDYLCEIDWDKYKNIKGWHIALKTKPSFAKILNKVIPGYKPPEWYKTLY